MTGQNQYDPARPLTSRPTRHRTHTRRADPERFVPAAPAARPASLLLAGLLALGALLAAAPRDVSGIALSTLAGGAWLSIVLAMMLPSREERAGMELARRLGLFRHQVSATGDAPTRDSLERLLRLANELKLPDAEIAEDLERIRASLDALTLRDALRSGAWPTAASPDTLSAGDTCHFVCPVRFGRRRNDQYGHLVLTRARLKFRGALDMSVAWSEVASVERAERELIVGLQDSRRMLRFSCHTFDEAARGGVIAAELAGVAAKAAAEPGPPAPFQAV